MNSSNEFIKGLARIVALHFMLSGSLNGLDLSNLLGKSQEQRNFDREFDEIVANY